MDMIKSSNVFYSFRRHVRTTSISKCIWVSERLFAWVEQLKQYLFQLCKNLSLAAKTCQTSHCYILSNSRRHKMKPISRECMFSKQPVIAMHLISLCHNVSQSDMSQLPDSVVNDSELLHEKPGTSGMQ